MKLRTTDCRKAGVIKAVMLTDKGPFHAPTRKTGSAKAGMKYEKDFHKKMLNEYGKHYHPNQWFHYQNCQGWFWAQTDGILFLPELSTIVILECKLKHNYRSWYQLKDLYEPIVRFAFGEHYTILLVEVTKFFDPATPYPSKPHFMKSFLGDLPVPGQVGVYLWKN